MTARIISSEPDPATAPVRYESIDYATLISRPDPEWLVEHWCMREAITMIAGYSESFKTFIAMDMAVKAASTDFNYFGKHFIDRSSVGGGGLKVVYIIGESRGAGKFRFQAIQQHHGIDMPPTLRYRDDKVDMYSHGPAVLEWVEREDPDIIIFDTLSRNTYGVDENNLHDMAKILGLAHDLKRGGTRGGRSVVFLHHQNKAGGFLRGHSALLNDTDIGIKVVRHDADSENTEAPFYSRVISERQKETDDFQSYYVELDTHTIKEDDGVTLRLSSGGKPYTSLVIKNFAATPPGVTTAKAAGFSRPAPASEAIVEYIKAHPGRSATEIQAALHPDNPTGKAVAVALGKLGALVDKVDGKYFVRPPAPLDPLDEI